MLDVPAERPTPIHSNVTISEASHYRARYYDPVAGRFLREDPRRFAAGVNFYAYANNQPSNMIDPFGLWPNWGEMWNGAKKTWDNSKEAYNKGKEYAEKIGCWTAYYYCISTTFDNLDSISQASQGMPRYTQDELENPTQNEGASHGAHQIKQCIAGNENCKKVLDDCLKGLLSGGIFPH